MITVEKHYLFEQLQEYKQKLEAKGHNVYAIMLKGSQNYNLDDDESDIDANAIIIPTLADLRKNTSYKYEFETGEVTCHNIYSFADIVAKGNPQWIEVCHTEYKIGNSLDMFKHYDLNPSALKGMVMEKVNAFSKLYPSQKSQIEKYGYAPKQLHHIIRLVDLLVARKVSPGLKVLAYKNPRKDALIEIKRGKLPLQEAEALRDEYLQRLERIYEEAKLKYQPQEVDYAILDEIVMQEYCK